MIDSRIGRWLCTTLVLAAVGCNDAGRVEVLDGGSARDLGLPDALDGSAPDALVEPDALVDAFFEPVDAASDARADAMRDLAIDAFVPRDAGPTEMWSVSTTETSELATHGGGGGSPQTAGCAVGHVLRGFQGFVDIVPIRATLVCSSLEPDGTLGSPVPSRVFGGSRDGLPFSDICPAGEVVIGLHGSIVFGFADFYVNRLGIVCAPLDGWARRIGPRVVPVATRGDARPEEVAFDERCPPGSVVTQIGGRAGAFIDQITGGCARIDVVEE